MFYIGLMSGTSADGIDAALVDFSAPKPKLVETFYEAYSPELRQEVLALSQPGQNEITRMADLDVKLGRYFGAAVKSLLKKAKVPAKKIRAIGSHGQTIRHLPEINFTLQIGDPNIIAAETGITTIADFRRRDMAHGGQGAPLVPAFHKSIFRKKNTDRVIVNIGGIANVTLLPARGNIIGFDTGPGNGLMDAWIEKNLQKTHDENGDWAASGKINNALLKKCLADPYFKKSAPKSTGREYFNLAWLEKKLEKNLAPVDIQTTLAELTAETIIKSIPFSSGEIFVCGGGARNQFLMSRLKNLAPQFSLNSTEKLGVHPDWVEAMAFAWLAKQTLNGKPGNIPEVTGANSLSLLGGIYPVR